jgi:hypothetical protein
MEVPDVRAIMQDLANKVITFERYKGLPQDESTG